MAKLYGVGVGPGDWELMTLKAVRIIEECNVIAIPKSGEKINAALTIAGGAIKHIEQKRIIELDMPMTRDREKLERCHEDAKLIIEDLLKRGENVAFLTLGDPSVYSTYVYVHNRVVRDGYEAEIVPGIPSFCAVAARLNEGLTDAEKPLHIIPASYDVLEDCMKLEGTKILMKSGRALKNVKELISDNPDKWTAKMVERCGMDGERVFENVDDIDTDASYFSIVVVKDK